jgi:hypothetical protein
MLPSVKLFLPPSGPRMADFAQLGEAMTRAMGGQGGRFPDPLHQPPARRHPPHRGFQPGGRGLHGVRSRRGIPTRARSRASWERLNNFSMSMERGDYWPRSPRGLGDSLRRVAPALRQIGIQVSVDAKPRRDGVHCEVRLADDSASYLVPSGRNLETNRTRSQRSQPSPTFAGTTYFDGVRRPRHEPPLNVLCHGS